MSAEKFSVKLVVIDDDQQILDLITDALDEEEHLQILATTDPARGLETVLQEHPQIVLLDLMMPQIGGMELLERIVEAEPSTDVILLTGDYSTESAVEAIQKGASDYLTKPVNLERLSQCVKKSVAAAHKGQRALELDRELAETFRCEGMVGRSPLMLEVFAKINRIAPHFKTVLISGETGTGKEVAARAGRRVLNPATISDAGTLSTPASCITVREWWGKPQMYDSTNAHLASLSRQASTGPMS